MFGDPDAATNDASFVRPFVITRGRTVGDAGDIPIETLVVAMQSGEGLGPDHAAVIEVCTGDPISVMEIAITIGLPIGVARVLVADLSASEHVVQYQTAATESAATVGRLLDGLRAL